MSALCLSSFHSSSLSSLHFIYILLLLTHSSSTFYFNQLLKIFFVGFEVEASTLIGAFCFPFSAGCLRNLSYAPAYFLIFISHKKLKNKISSAPYSPIVIVAALKVYFIFIFFFNYAVNFKGYYEITSLHYPFPFT